MSDVALLTLKIPVGVKDRKMVSLWEDQKKMNVPVCEACIEKFPKKTEFILLNSKFFCFECASRHMTGEKKP